MADHAPVTLVEKWDIPMLNRLVRAAAGVSPHSALLLQALSRLNKATGELRVTYKHATGTPFGRRYGYPSLQSTPGWIRRLCASRYYHDVDIENCFPVILEQVARRHDLNCPLLSQYVRDRQAVFDCVAAELPAAATPWSRDQLKKCFLITLHNGDYTYSVTNGGKSPFLDGFAGELRHLTDTLRALPEFAEMSALLESKSGKPNKQGTFVAWVCQVAEDQIIQAIQLYLSQQNRVVGVQVFDGVMVEREGPNPLSEQLLRGAEQHVKTTTGFQVRLVEKPLEPRQSDYEQLRALEQHEAPTLFQGWRVTCLADKHVQDISFREQTRAVLINASMGLGKSTAAKRYIEKHQPKRILTVTARRQQARTVLGELQPLGFVHYGDLPTHDMANQDRLIIQYESLHKLMGAEGGLQPFDLVLVDEIRAVVGQICCVATNKEHLKENAQLFRALLDSSQCLFMDADLEYDCMVRVLVEEIWGKEQVEVLRYTHTALPRELRIMSETAWMKALLLCLQMGRRAMVAFRSKKDMEVVLKAIKKDIPNLGTLEFSSDSTEEDMKAFQNINEAVGQVQLLCFTSKVTVGADIQTCIDEIFVHAKAVHGCTARDIFQMIGRARNVTDATIRVVLPLQKFDQAPVVGTRSEAFDAKLQLILEHKELRKRYLQIVDQVQPRMIEGRLRWTPDWITKVLACQLAEQDTDFTTDFATLARDKHYDMTMEAVEAVQGDEDLRDAITAAKEQLAKEHSEMEEQILTSIQTAPEPVDLTGQIEELQQRQIAGGATPEDKLRLQLLRVCARFPLHYRNMSPSDIHSARRNMSALFKLKYLQAHPNGDHRAKDLDGVKAAPILELAKMSHGQVHHTQLAVRAAGFDGLGDYETEVPATELKRNARTITAHSDLAAKLENRRIQAKTRNPKIKAMNALRRELTATGHQLVKVKRKRQRPVDDDMKLQPDRMSYYQLRRTPRLERLLPHFMAETPKKPAPVVNYDLLEPQLKRRRM